MNFQWERLSDGVHRCRLPFLDVTVGVVHGRTGTLLVDTGTTLTEADAVKADVEEITGGTVSHIVLTHNHFDHILGSSAFGDAEVYCAPRVAETIGGQAALLWAEAVRYGVDPEEVARTVAALRAPEHVVVAAEIDLGDRTAAVAHPGRGHTDHDLIVVVAARGPTVVFCGDLVEESGDPAVDEESDPAAWPATLGRLLEIGGSGARFVPGHGAVVDAAFVDRQRRWLLDRGRS